jgi:NTE family protein
MVSFELARRHRFAADMASLPADVAVHLLPTGAEPTTLITQLRYRSHAGIAGRIDVAYAASVRYLDAL